MADNSPAPFESLVKKIRKCMFHVLVHISSHVDPGPEAARVLEHTLSISSSSSGSATCLAAKRPLSLMASPKCKRDGGASTGARAHRCRGRKGKPQGLCADAERSCVCVRVCIGPRTCGARSAGAPRKLGAQSCSAGTRRGGVDPADACRQWRLDGCLSAVSLLNI